MANRLNGYTKWIALALSVAGSVVMLTLAFSEKASNDDVHDISTRINSTCERVAAVERSVEGQDKRLERIEDKIDRLLERGK